MDIGSERYFATKLRELDVDPVWAHVDYMIKLDDSYGTY